MKVTYKQTNNYLNKNDNELWTNVWSLYYWSGYWSVVYLLNCCVVIELTKRKTEHYHFHFNIYLLVICHLHHIYLFIFLFFNVWSLNYWCGYWSVVYLLNCCVVIELTKRKTVLLWLLILTNPVISQINTLLLPYLISYYSSAFTIN